MAVRRDQRAHAPQDWQRQVEACPGATLVGRDGGRMVVDLDAAAQAQLGAQLGAWLHIEPVVVHHVRPPLPPDAT